MKKKKKKGGTTFVLFLWYPPPRSSFVSDVFDFNISLNDAAPLSPMSLTIDAVPARICEESFVSQQCSIIILQN